MPLNRRVFGLSYEITESCRNFKDNRLGQTREMCDHALFWIIFF